MSPRFLDLETVLRIHDESLREFGGLAGVRGPELLASALAQPSATFGGEFLHEDVFAMAVAEGRLDKAGLAEVLRRLAGG